jgi:hypothetical protein
LESGAGKDGSRAAQTCRHGQIPAATAALHSIPMLQWACSDSSSFFFSFFPGDKFSCFGDTLDIKIIWIVLSWSLLIMEREKELQPLEVWQH